MVATINKLTTKYTIENDLTKKKKRKKANKQMACTYLKQTN